MTPFTSYAPDLTPETEGIITDCENVIPYPDGYRAQNSALNALVDPLAGEARGFAVVRKLDNTHRTFAATRTAIYELTATTWTDRSDTGGYDLGADQEVSARFVQFGNATLAAVGHNRRIQTSSTGAFAAIANAPKARVIETVNNFVFVFNYVDDVYGLGTRENGWWCSGLGNETQWSPSVTTQSVAGQFLETAGGVVAAKRLGSYIVAYKEKSAFIGQYVGAPAVWSWQQLPGEIGALSQECIVNIGTAHYFISTDDFQMFDGSRFTAIGTPVRNTFFNDLDPKYRSRVRAGHDQINDLVYWFYPSKSSGGVIDKCIVYNYKLDKWGRSDIQIEAVAEYIESGITYDSLGSSYATYDDLPENITYDSTFWTAYSPVVAFFTSDHKVNTFGGTPGNSSITTWHIGDLTTFTTITAVRPRFLKTPSSSTADYSYSPTNADEMVSGSSSSLYENKYDLLWSARWHKLKMNFAGVMTINGIGVELSADGQA